MKTILLLTLLSLNNPKDTIKTCIKKKSCCNLKTTDTPKYCVGMLPKDTTKTCTKKKSCCKKKEK
jgi:hypothetical protein